MRDDIIDDIGLQVERIHDQNEPRPLPNGDLVLVLGICSIVFCMLYGIFGIVAGSVALYYFAKVQKLYLSNPAAYTEASYKNAKAGRVCAIVGMSLGGFFILALVFGIIYYASIF